MPLSGSPGDAAARIRESATCKGTFSGLCDPEIEKRMTAYDEALDAKQRETILNDVQTLILDQYLIVPILRQAFINTLGPRIANKPEEIEGAIPQYVYLGPYEDIQLTG
jgi:ABC-type oligopeptide transport system substrate-binding subunit